MSLPKKEKPFVEKKGSETETEIESTGSANAFSETEDPGNQFEKDISDKELDELFDEDEE
ncbi:hypothetical protein ACI6Q2_19965 [Chitinophagaceae bacterium LWZ2-11]